MTFEGQCVLVTNAVDGVGAGHNSCLSREGRMARLSLPG